MSRKPPRAYFSLRSPFSWMAMRRLSERLPCPHEHLELIPYWDPDADTNLALGRANAKFHYVQMSRAKHMYILQDTKRLSRHLGYEMAWPIDRDPWWELPHLAWLQARHDGDEQRLYAALTAARWGRGEDICELATFTRVVDEAGLDGARLAAAADDAELRAEGTDGLVRAYHDDVFGIPFFIVGRHKFWGLDRLDAYLDELAAATGAPVREVASGSWPDDDDGPLLAAMATATGPPLDHDTAGGCG